MPPMTSIRFQDVKDKILDRLNKDDITGDIAESLTLIDGFINMPFTQSIGEITIPKEIIPMVMAVGDRTKRVYFFAFNALEIDSIG